MVNGGVSSKHRDARRAFDFMVPVGGTSRLVLPFFPGQWCPPPLAASRPLHPTPICALLPHDPVVVRSNLQRIKYKEKAQRMAAHERKLQKRRDRKARELALFATWRGTDGSAVADAKH